LRIFFRLIPIVSLFGLLTMFGISINRQAAVPAPSQPIQVSESDNVHPLGENQSLPLTSPQVGSKINSDLVLGPLDLPVTSADNSKILPVESEIILKKPNTEIGTISRLPVFLQNFVRDWKLEQSGGCMEAWDFRPGLSKLPVWLQTPENAGGLNTTNAYYILAGMLIRNKLVDASSCPSAGLASNSNDNLAANNCGMNIALPTVISWQNRFNSQIYDVSQQSGIPAMLLKNVFRQESQFWPGVFLMETEGGLGQMTNIGSDTLLMWSQSLFDNICNKSFSQDVCDRGYTNLNSAEKAILQGALFQLVNASCPECAGGIDIQQAEFSVGLFAENLLSNCKQTGALVDETAAVKYPSLVSTYPDLWKMTLFNYNAGPGCLDRALRRAWIQDPNTILTWDRVVSQVDSECVGGINYVSEITK
jgi:hypothetical protein